jgi:hypothetical protein
LLEPVGGAFDRLSKRWLAKPLEILEDASVDDAMDLGGRGELVRRAEPKAALARGLRAQDFR